MINKNNWSLTIGQGRRLHLELDDWFSRKTGFSKTQNRKLNKFKTVTYVEATRKIIDEIRNFNIK